MQYNGPNRVKYHWGTNIGTYLLKNDNDIGNAIVNAVFQPAVIRNSLKNKDKRKLFRCMG